MSESDQPIRIPDLPLDNGSNECAYCADRDRLLVYPKSQRHDGGAEGSPLLEKEGWPRREENCPVPYWRGRGGHSEIICRSDHPGCGASVASRLLIDAAATPPLQGGECLRLRISTLFQPLIASFLPNNQCDAPACRPALSEFA